MALSQQEETETFPSGYRNSGGLLEEISPIQERQLYAFGDYRLDPQECRLWCNGVPVPLSPKSFDLLLVMVEHAGQLLEKEKLLRAVWPDTFVEEGNLSVYVSGLRKVFGKEVPHRDYIETIPKRGYRFNVPVTVCSPIADFPASDWTTESETAALAEADAAADTPPVADLPKNTNRSTTWRAHLIWLVLAVLCVACTVVFLRSKHTVRSAVSSGNSRPLTSLPGRFTRPSFSPDGQRLAYAWRSGSEKDRAIYIQDIKSDERSKLTRDFGDNFSPAWSPRGEEVAYLHSSGQSELLDLIITNVQNPSVQRTLATIQDGGAAFRAAPSLSWSPDGRWLLTTDVRDARNSSSLTLVSLENGQKQTLTHPSPRTVDDDATFSPNGEFVAFRRSLGSSSDDIYVIPAHGGTERRLTFQAQAIDGLVWSADSQSIIVSSGRATSVGSLWRLSVSGDTPVALTTPLVHTSDPTISASAHRLAYVNLLRNVSTWRMSSDGHGEPEQVIASNFLDSAADYSPDGSRIVFRSDRSGANEIWTSRSDGRDPRRITSFYGPMTGSPKWSPDGQWITFDSRTGGRSAIFIVRSSGGSPIDITTGAFASADNVVPSWSRDGQSIYFSSNRTGEWQIWRKHTSGDSDIQVTTQGGFNALESPDGRDLYFVQDVNKTDVWRVNLADGKSERVVDDLGPGMWGYWTLSGSNLYYMQRKSNGSAPADIYRMNTVNGSKVKLGKTQFGVNGDDKGLAVSPDGRWLLYAQRDVDRSTIMIVDDFD